jgi:hypothetical protein
MLEHPGDAFYARINPDADAPGQLVVRIWQAGVAGQGEIARYPIGPIGLAGPGIVLEPGDDRWRAWTAAAERALLEHGWGPADARGTWGSTMPDAIATVVIRRLDPPKLTGPQACLIRAAADPDQLTGPNLGWYFLYDAQVRVGQRLAALGLLRQHPLDPWHYVQTTPAGRVALAATEQQPPGTRGRGRGGRTRKPE